jgi:hypothetical protein
MKYIKYTALLLLIILIIGSFCILLRPSGVKVTITNASDEEFTNVKIRLVGDEHCVPNLKKGDQIELYVNPKSESGLTIEYNDSHQNQQIQELPIYVEPGYGGRLDIDLYSHDNISWIDDIHIGTFWSHKSVKGRIQDGKLIPE